MAFPHSRPTVLADWPALGGRCRSLQTHLAALRNSTDAAFARQFPAAVAAVEALFRHEEALLDQHGDACLHACLADHALILCALHRIAARVERGDVAPGRRVVDALDAMLTMPAVAPPLRARGA